MTDRRLEDRQTLNDLLIDYCVALDRREFSRLVSDVFAPDATFAGNGAKWIGAPQIAERIEGTFAAFEGTAHMLSNVRIDVEGDRASSLAYITAWHWLKRTPPGPAGRAADWALVAAYRDVHVRTEAGWRISRREFENVAPSTSGIGEMPKLEL